MIVGKNTQLEFIHKRRNEIGEQAYLMAKTIVLKHYPIDDDTLFRKSFSGYLTMQISKEKYVSKLNESITWGKLDELHSRYKEYHVNFDQYSYDLELVNDNQINIWKSCLKLCDVLNKAGDDFAPPWVEFSYLKFEEKWIPDFDLIMLK